MEQKKAFLEGEGDAWHKRNSGAAVRLELPDGDPLLSAMLKLTSPAATDGATILEIGCGDGARLAWLKENRACECYGIDPSERAVAAASQRGVLAQRGTAELLPFSDRMFDIVAFGFCLYVCDREDLFRVACEADRVLKHRGWLLIYDFYDTAPSKREYHHRPGLFSYKMDYRTVFTWHPSYTNYSHMVFHHSRGGYTDDPNEWVAVSVLRKNFR